MNKIYQRILLSGCLLLTVAQGLLAQSSPNCNTASDNDFLTGRAFFNFGSVSNSFNTKNRANVTVGQPVVGTYFGQLNKGTYGFWARFLLPPAAPMVAASEGDQEDRVQIDWNPDPLSPAPTAYKIYRNGSLLASVDGETFSFLDFNVIAGKFYTYEVSGVNVFGEGTRGKALGFLNPNGVVTGQVKSLGGNPVPGTVVTLTPTIGTSGVFAGDDMAFAEYSPAFPRSEFTLSCWVKLDNCNDNTAIFDLGSTISKNWWLHTLPAADGKGVRFGMGNGPGSTTELDYAFPAASADDWHYIAATYNGSSLLLYADGELIETAVADIAVDSMTLFLGQKANGIGYYKGKLDELRFFNRQLSQTELQMFMNRTVAPDAQGLVNYWKFDEGVGTKTFDLTASKQKVYFCGAGWSSDKPNVLNAGLTNDMGFYEIPGVNYGAGITFTARPFKNFYFNQSLEFNSVNNQYAELTDFDLADSSTVEISVKAFDFSGDQCILTKQNGGTTHFGLHLNAGVLMLEMGGSTQNLGALGMGFHRLAFVIEQPGGGSSATVNYYKDGTFVNTYSFSGVAANMKGGTPWILGARYNGADLERYFSGLIDEAVFYKTLVSLADLQAAANIGTNITREDIKNNFPLNEGSGTKLRDYGSELTGNGTIHGATFSTVAAIAKEEPHKFTPSTKLLTLNPSNTSVDQVDFTDQSTVPVSGFVRFEGTNCFQKNVEILVNGEHASPLCFTDSTGYFSLDLEPGATVKLTPVFKQHTFYPAFWDVENVASPVAGILFRNQVKRFIAGQMAGNAVCRKSVIPDGAIVKVKVETLDGCYYKELQLADANGKFKFNNLPPLKFTVAVTEHSNNVIYNYFQLKGGFTVDLTDVSDTTDFIYYAPPQIEMTPLDTNACGATMLEQDGRYSTDIRVFQAYDGGVCYLDTAQLHIENLIEGEGPLDTLMTTGKFKYKFIAGFPNIAAPYQKTMTILAKANELENTLSASAVVLGKRPRLVNFTSTSPQLPLMILRDPPGDGSSASIEKGTTICNGWSVDVSGSVKASIGLDLDLGNKQQIISGTPAVGKITEIGFENSLEMGVSVKTGFSVNKSAEVCMTATEKISTSGGDVVIGEDADVYVGGALNLLFGITDDLRWDTANCSFFIKPGLLVFPDKFATTFLYSGYQIKKVVIPNLELVGDTTSANQWRAILQRNADLKAAASFEKNLSFDAGVTYENSTSIENTSETKFGFEVELGATIASSIGFDIDGIGSKVKMGLELSMGVKSEFSSKQTNTQTVSYTLADDDIKDVFTVNVLQDKVYATPVFKTVSGNSSCPWEPNTVPRDGVELTVDKTIIANVPMNDKAVFKFNIGNTSQTDEYRTYYFELYNATNPNGAIVKVQGAGASGSFGMYANQSQEVVVTIERGPTAFDYENLTFHVYSACEGNRYDALGNGDFPPAPFYKAINVSVHFLEPCSPIDIGFPLENWVFTPADGSTMFITLNEFDRHDPDLALLRVQYRRKQGDGAWINIVEVPKADLDNDVFKIVQWDTGGLQDGEYEIRAVSECVGGQNAGISHVISGRFERHPPVVLGTPEPADGVLSRGDEISITFNELIRCNQIIRADQFDNNNVGLYDTETGNLIDAVVTCSGDKIVIVPNVPNRFIENKVLRVQVNNIKDLADNNFIEKKWEFFVDRNPIRWEGGNVKVAKLRPQFVSVTRRLLNDGGQATAFELQDIPTWARVYPATGVIQPGAAEEITIEVDSSLAFGNYADTLFADAPEGREPLIVNARVLCEPPVWDFNPGLYAQVMNFTLQLDIEGALSTDEQDIVAAFIDGQVRGKAYVKYLPALDKYMAFLTVYGHDGDDGKPLSLEIWDASACLRYGKVLESFQFQTDNVIGTIGTPTVLHTNNMVRRDIPLATGWNWFSFNLALPDFNINPALASLKDPYGDLVKSKTAFALRGSIWYGSLTGFNNREMFQYRADKPDTIIALGAVIDPASVQIPVVAGWNWIGYIPNYALTVNQALAGLTPLNGDILRGQTAFAQYLAGFGWFGSMQYMEAPHGYQLKISNPGTLVYPPQPQGKGPKAESAAPKFPLYWQVDASRYEHSMTLVGMISAGGTNATQQSHEIGAFVGNELRGSAQAIYIEPLDAYFFFLTTFANVSGELVQFKLYDATTGKIADLTERMFFVPDLHQGALETPVPFSLKSSGVGEITGAIALSVNPNPFRETTTLWFESTAAQEVRISVTDAAGRTVLSQPVMAVPGLNSFRWDARDADAGVYFVRLEMAEGTAVRRVVRE